MEPWAKLKKTTSAEDKNLAIRELLVMAEGAQLQEAVLSAFGCVLDPIKPWYDFFGCHPTVRAFAEQAFEYALCYFLQLHLDLAQTFLLNSALSLKA